MAEKSSIFDRTGQVMVAPSSSNKAGVVRIAQGAIQVLGCQPRTSEISFYNSFTRTYKGYGFDRATIAGLLNFKTDDICLKDFFKYAARVGLQYFFKSVGNASAMHPNTVKINLSKGNRQVEVVGQCRDGSVIRIVEVDGFTPGFSANLHTIIDETNDVKGSIAFKADVIAHYECNVPEMNVSRRGKNQLARHFIEMDTAPKPLTRECIWHLSWIKNIT